jgi:hypothetical protein
MARASHTSSTAIRHLERLLKVSAPVKHRPSTGTAVSHLFSTGSGGSGGDGGAGSAGAEGNCGGNIGILLIIYCIYHPLISSTWAIIFILQ